MIRCTVHQLAYRAGERGYTWEQVAPCIVARDGDTITVDTSHPAYPRKGLGDAVAAGLSAVGITPERVSRAIGKPCGCNKRKQALNRVGRRLGVN